MLFWGSVSMLEAGGIRGGFNQNFYQLSAQVGLTSGDYVSNQGGLNTYYAYFIEVPPGTGQLTVEIFDGDVTSGSSFDILTSQVQYQLFDPNGVQVLCNQCNGAGAGCPAGACLDNAWWNYSTTVAPIPGHWELRVDMSLPISPSAALNGYAVRAHDGDPTPGGTELNVYGLSYLQPGDINGSSPPVLFELYPYVTSGCEVDSNDFDFDSPNSTIGVFTRSGVDLSAQTTTISGNGTWQNNPLTGWTSCSAATDYGLWNAEVTFLNAQNWNTYYWGAFNAADPPSGGAGPPPTAQPESNSVRIYLPADADGVPIKPYVNQELTFVNGSGPNPPAVGSTSRFSVTVRVVNPTGNSITFSGPSNVVQSFVPASGGQVGYVAGSAAAGQGSVTSEPPAGGSGSVVWDPGVVAAGATAILSYDVEVTPTAPGTIDVTGTPASNGTTATFVDETCSGAACAGAQLAGATLAFGPLCQLAVNTSLATHALVSEFDAAHRDGRAVVTWTTTSEAAAVGYRLYRDSPVERGLVEVGSGLLATTPGTPQGAHYRIVDDSIDTGARVDYYLEEIRIDGSERLYGPFSVVVGEERGHEDEPLARPYAVHPRSPSRLGPWPTYAGRSDAEAGGSARRLKLAIREDGFYRLGAVTIASLFGITRQQAEAAIANHLLSLENRGEGVAWVGAPNASAIHFWAATLDSIYTEDNVYWLEPGLGERLDLADGQAPSPQDGTSFLSTLVSEENLFAATAVPADPESDYWYWEFLSAGDPFNDVRTFTLDVLALAESRADAELTVDLASATTVETTDEHQVEIYLNDAFLGVMTWTGLDRQTKSFSFPPAWLEEGANVVELRAVLGPGIPFSIVYVDGFRLVYPRRYVAENNELRLRADGNPVVSVSGFEAQDLEVMELTDPGKPTRLTNLTLDGLPGNYRVSFVPRSSDTEYIVFSRSLAGRAPSAVWADRPSDLKNPTHSADYLLVTHRDLAPAAAPLVGHRGSTGLTTMAIDIEDTYDEFNHGIASPNALRDFLAYAHENWDGPPRFVSLAGAGTYDYKDYLELGGNLVPPLMVSTVDGLFAADNLFGDVEGHDGVPEIAVGRIPARTLDELDGYVAKLIAYETQAEEPWMAEVILAADVPDAGGDFSVDSQFLEVLLPGQANASQVFLEDLPIDDAREELFDLLGAGAVLLNYYGHGGLDRLSSSGLLTLDDVAALLQGPRVPMLTAMTCTVNRFEIPGFDALGPALTLSAEGGAIATWSPAGLSEHGWATDLASTLAVELFALEDRTVGGVLLRAMQRFLAQGGTADLVRLYNLVGDPALALVSLPRDDVPLAPDDML